MIKHILVPLDGSHLAESVLPAAGLLAEKLGATVTLLHLIESNPPETVHGEPHLTTTAAAESYLTDLAAHAFAETVGVDWHVHTVEVTNVASSIVEHTDEMHSDLVILCTHGQTGLRDWMFGTIAQKVISMGQTPVLLIPAKVPTSADEPADFQLRKLLVLLDGKPEHEGGLPLAVELGRACEATLMLLTVVQTLETLSGEEAATGKLLPNATSVLLDLAEQEARAYLTEQITAHAADGVTITGAIQRGDPVDTILATAATQQADLIVLTTHGRKGTTAFWARSVAPKVTLRATTPLLLVRAAAT